MATLFKGGISKVEYDDNVSFTTPTEIPGILKDTTVEFSTPTEELASGKAAAAGKQVKLNIVSEDLTVATYTELIAAEEAHTPVFFRVTGINSAQKLVVKSVIPTCEIKPGEAGKVWRRIVTGVGFADTEANLMTLTLA